MEDPNTPDRLVRIDKIIGDKGVLDISASQFWKGCREGIYPKPKKLGPNITVWRWSEIQNLVRNGISEEA